MPETPPPGKKDPRAPVLVGGVALLGIACGLYVVARVLATIPDPGLREAGSGFAMLWPWFLLAGALLILLWYVIEKFADPPEKPKQPESILFDASTQMDDTRKD